MTADKVPPPRALPEEKVKGPTCRENRTATKGLGIKKLPEKLYPRPGKLEPLDGL